MATVVQLSLRGQPVRRLLLLSAAATVSCVAAPVLTVDTSSVPGLALAAALAGLAYGPGMLGGLALLNADIPADGSAEANAALEIGAYSVAGLVISGLGALSDRLGLATGVTAFALLLGAVSILGAALVLPGVRAAAR